MSDTNFQSCFYTAHDGLRLHMRDYGPREAEALNLDRADVLFTALGELRQAARAA